MTRDSGRIAMWSGPRNLSSAMMRSFGNRADMFGVSDEPLYASYLTLSGKTHPMRAEILASQSADWREVVRHCTASKIPDGMFVYQKHMTHHMLPELSRDWISGLINIFLIRDPRRVVASYADRFETVSLGDLGFRQQAELFDLVAASDGAPPPVVDAEDIRTDPAGVLTRLCSAIDIPFDPAMLHWEPGPRPGDGVWAPHWYASLNRSSGFAPPDPAPKPMTPEMEALAAEARPFYDRLRPHRL